MPSRKMDVFFFFSFSSSSSVSYLVPLGSRGLLNNGFDVIMSYTHRFYQVGNPVYQISDISVE